MDRFLGRFSPYTYSLLRIVAGLLFMCHGMSKFGLIEAPPPPPPARAQVAQAQPTAPPSQAAQTAAQTPGQAAPAPAQAAQARQRGPRMPTGRTLAAAIIETFGGGLMMVGLFTTWIAFIASGEMAFAYFLSHNPRGLFPLFNAGEPAVLFCFIWLYVASRGPGVWSLDALLFKQKPSRSHGMGKVA